MSIDDTITHDLHAFGAAHGHPRAAAPEPALRGHQPATSSERTALAVQRSATRLRVERLGPTHARRMARAVTGVAAVIAMAGLYDFLTDPAVSIEPAFNILGVLVLLAIVYLITRAVSARRFRRRFVRARRDGLEETYAAKARERVERLDGWSTGLAVFGLSCVVPFLAALYVCEPGWSGDYPPIAEAVFGMHTLRTCALVSIVPALLLGSAVTGGRGERRAWLRYLESPLALAVALGLAVIAFGVAISAAERSTMETMSAAGKLGRAVLAQVAITSLAAWTALRLRRGELARIGLSPAGRAT